MKEEFYPSIDKTQLVPDYIAERSGHSRGSTIDLTVVKLPAQQQPEYKTGDKLVSCVSDQRYKDNMIDMGTGFDCLSLKAHTDTANLT